MSPSGAPRPVARDGDRHWLGYLGLAAAAGAAFLADRHGPAATVLYPGIAGSAAVAVVIGLWRHRPATALPWILFAFGLAMFAVADGIWIRQIGSPGSAAPFLSLADAFYLAAYPFLALGLMALARRSAGRAAWSDLADGLIVALSAADLSWLFVIHPNLQAGGGSFLAQAVSLAYPVADLVVLYAAARLVLASRGRVPAFLLLVGALLALLAADAAFYAGLAATGAPYGGDLAYVAWVASYLLFGAAALHPSMTYVAAPQSSVERSLSELRTLGFFALLLPGPAISIYRMTAGSGDTLDATVVTLISAMLAVVMLVRLASVAGYAQQKAYELDRQAISLQAALDEQVALQRQLAHQAFHDPLTELPNRALLNERLTHALRRRAGADTTVLLMLDLDGFKSVNDTLGHPSGDRLLIEVARRLVETVRRGDTVARLGGDEFAVLLEDTSPEAACSIADRVVEAVREPVPLQGRDLHVTVSVGILLSCGDVTPEEAVRDADVALYYAKSGGRNQIRVFEPGMRHAAIQRATLESDLRTALARNQFALHYQPIYDLVGDSLVGVEALLRWRHPGRGPVPPTQFIPVAEETGLIFALGEWVLMAACRQLSHWRREHASAHSLRLSLNLSGRQIREGDFAEAVGRALAVAALPPDALIFEVPESVLAVGIEPVIGTLRELRQLGVSIALDNFGTGYSSLAHLRQLPFDLVKIDRSLLRDESADEEWGLTRGIIQLSESMHLPTIAAGVETAQQAARLAEFHCQLAQGYYFAPPLTAADVDGLLADAPQAVAGGQRWPA